MAFPKINACIICEAVRPEPANKFMLLGVFGMAPNVYILLQNFASPLTLCFLFMGNEGSGHFNVGLRIMSEAGLRFDAQSVDVDIRAGIPGANIFLNFSAALPGPGDYSVQLLVDGASVYETKFNLKQAPIQQLTMHN